jgi:hypothetical protein
MQRCPAAAAHTNGRCRGMKPHTVSHRCTSNSKAGCGGGYSKQARVQPTLSGSRNVLVTYAHPGHDETLGCYTRSTCSDPDSGSKYPIMQACIASCQYLWRVVVACPHTHWHPM